MVIDAEKIRLDKWLWAARFFKTRALAAEAVNGGKVHLNNNRVKASRPVTIGDSLRITRGHVEFNVGVLALSSQRRPAIEARQLYEETAESIKKRESERELRKALNVGHSPPATKPNKKDRRKIKTFTRKS